jgi:tetratricopeptide (TPR) repeat protein
MPMKLYDEKALLELAKEEHRAGFLLRAYQKYSEIKHHNPKCYEALKWMGTIKLQRHRYEQAKKLLLEALEISEDSALLTNLGNALKGLGEFDQAEVYYTRATEADPSNLDALINLGLLLMLKGDTNRGLILYEARRHKHRKFDKPLWMGNLDLAGKTILLHSEQGLGDTIMMSRYAAEFVKMGARVILEVQPKLVSLMKTLGFPGEITFPTGAALPAYDYHIPMMSLFYAFGGKVLPWKRYLKPPVPAPVMKSSHRVAICWQGSEKNKELGYSFPKSMLDGIAKIPGVEIVELQYDGTPDSDKTFLEVAAILGTVDLLISTDTAIAHLAGAMGIRTWLPLAKIPDWRWGLEGISTPWYPNHTLFRQSVSNVWADVFEDMEIVLRELLMTHTKMPVIPVSWGEVIDKITILELKARKIQEPSAQANIRRELDILVGLSDSQKVTPIIIAEYYQLLQINGVLWEAEETLRRKEKELAFDNEYLLSARRVYMYNDERAKLKKKINETLGSELVEEKSY